MRKWISFYFRYRRRYMFTGLIMGAAAALADNALNTMTLDGWQAGLLILLVCVVLAYFLKSAFSYARHIRFRKPELAVRLCILALAVIGLFVLPADSLLRSVFLILAAVSGIYLVCCLTVFAIRRHDQQERAQAQRSKDSGDESDSPTSFLQPQEDGEGTRFLGTQDISNRTTKL